jgi:hypothetical protein
MYTRFRSGSFRSARLPRILVVAALGSGPALMAGAAYAAPAGQPTVEFSGGSVLNMLVCKSQPSTGRLTVPAESKVSFVNRLGQNATLRMSGKTVTSVGANQAVPVVFHHGPVEVAMTISCSAGVVEEFRSVTVGVSPKPAGAQPAAAPTPTSTGRGAGNSTAAARGAGARATAGTSTPSTEASVPAVDPSAPWATASPAGVPAADAGNGEGGGVAPGAADVGDVVAASGEPVHGPSGLLAMIAAVLTVGVGVAAVRAALARRTSGARFA